MNDNPKNNILLSENIRQKRLTILEYFDAYICHHYQPRKWELKNLKWELFFQVDNDDKYMHRNIPELLIFFV